MVRTAPDREQVVTTRLSVMTAVVAGLIVFAVWAWLERRPQVHSARRAIADVEVQWVCSDNPHHRRSARGGYEPVPCPVCGAPCFMAFTFVCPVHRERFEAMVKIARDPSRTSAGERITAYRILAPGETWHDSDGHVRCPVPGCNKTAERPRPSWKHRSVQTDGS